MCRSAVACHLLSILLSPHGGHGDTVTHRAGELMSIASMPPATLHDIIPRPGYSLTPALHCVEVIVRPCTVLRL